MVRQAKIIGIIAGAIASVGAAAGVILKYQPFAWADDVVELAQVSYPTAINQRWDMLLILQSRLDEAKKRGDTATAVTLQQQEQRIQQEIESLKERQKKFGK